MKAIGLISAIATTLLLVSPAFAQFNYTWTAFPYPNITSTNSIFVYDNTVTNGLFTLLILLALFVIMILSFHTRTEIDSSMAAASFICMIISAVLRTTSQLGDVTFMLFAILLGVSIAIMYRGGPSY